MKKQFGIIHIVSYTVLSTVLISCVGMIKSFFPTVFTVEDLAKEAKKIVEDDKVYYKIQQNGDSLPAGSKEAYAIMKQREHCDHCELAPTDIKECSSKDGIFKWNNHEWVTCFVKGKANMYYTFAKTGYSSTTKSATHTFYFFFEKNGGINPIETVEFIKDAVRDNAECTAKMNELFPAGSKMEETKLLRLAEIIRLYNRT